MDFRQLEMFRSVAEQGTFTRAASHLHVSQSAVSRQVKLLEEELGQVLLHRGPHAATLTEAGELLLKTANRVQRELQDAVWQISARKSLGGGTVHLAGGMTVCMYVLPRLLKRFRALYRGVDLQVTSGPSTAILRLIRQHEVDLALLTLPIVATDLEVIPALKEEMVVVSAGRHPLARHKTVEPRALGRFPLILYESGSNTRKVQDHFFQEEGVPARVAMETENVEIIKAMVANGLGVTIIPFAAVARDVRQGRLACARVKGRRLYRETGWVYSRSDYIPRAVTELLRLFGEIKGQFGTQLDPGQRQ
jgi:DNA-binding transcriptional LysR family regulator